MKQSKCRAGRHSSRIACARQQTSRADRQEHLRRVSDTAQRRPAACFAQNDVQRNPELAYRVISSLREQEAGKEPDAHAGGAGLGDFDGALSRYAAIVKLACSHAAVGA